VILTRFSRVTFNAAHKYLGLTSEVLRTEKAINDIACHPLPPSFYEGGGLQYLRHRFDGASSSASESESDYFNFTKSPKQTPLSPLLVSRNSSTASLSTASLGKIIDNPIPLKSSYYRDLKRSGSISSSHHHMVQAGDLLVPKSGVNDVFRPLSRSFSVLNTPRVSQYSMDDNEHGKRMKHNQRARWSADDFDLREEVMSCIAKSIGLLQPPLSNNDSVEELPASPPYDFRKASSSFTSPFGSLSLLDIGDDTSSTAASTVSSSNNLSGLDNEVEILFYAAGTTLARAGEMNTGAGIVTVSDTLCSLTLGLFYVIEGFLDILLPVKENDAPPLVPNTAQPLSNPEPRWSAPSQDNKKMEQKLLFTVKPGGIAGYLGPYSSKTYYKQRILIFIATCSFPVQHRIVRRHQGKNGHLCWVFTIACA